MKETTLEMKEKKKTKETLDSISLLKEIVEAKVDQLLSANRQLKKKVFDLYTIFEIARQMAGILETELLLENILKTCISQLDLKGALIVTKEEANAEVLDLSKSKGLDVNQEKIQFKVFGDFVKSLQTKNRPVFINELEKELFPVNLELSLVKRWRAELIVPLLSRNEIVGLLFLLPKNSNLSFSEADLEFLTILANQVSISLENAILYQTQKKTAQMLLQSEKLAALGQLSASIAHEVNNPLGIIKNYLFLLSEKVTSTKGKKELNVIKEEVERIAKIVRSLLDFYSPGKEKPTPTDLKKILDETISLVFVQMKKENIKIKKEFEDIKPILAYPDQLRQVFLNLLMNSKDSLPKGGEILVALAQKQGKIEINFADTGTGIPEKILPKIFEPFFTTKTDNKGTGLGLWICYSIIQNHKGKIKAANLKEKGACFTIELPIEKR